MRGRQLQKAIEATAYLLKLREKKHRMSYLKLIKLLYITERRHWQQFGAPFIGDRLVAMPFGPVCSGIYGMIQDKGASAPEWKRHFKTDFKFLQLTKDPTISMLSEADTQLLRTVYDEFAHIDRFEISELTHHFPEWRKNDPGDSSKPIPLEDLLAAVGRSQDAEELRKRAAYYDEVDALLGE